jgi:hypothetical protein
LVQIPSRPRPVVPRHWPGDQLCIAFDDAGFTPGLDTVLVRIIGQKRGHPRVVGEVPGGDILLLADEIGEGIVTVMPA